MKKNKKKSFENNSQTQAPLQIQQQYSGPIPPPNQLAQFEAIEKGLAGRIMTLAEKDAEHVRSVQKQQVELAHKKTEKESEIIKRGQMFGFIVMLLFLLCGFILILLNKKITGTLFSGVAIISIIGSFTYPLLKKSD